MRDSIKRLLNREIMTSDEVATLLGVDASTLRHRLARGQLEAIKKGQTLLFDRLDVELLHILSRAGKDEQ